MKKCIAKWTVSDLAGKYAQIDFPEYQREPNIWGRNAKQRLLDSMLRQFDIAPLYFYTTPDDGIACVDGRQRIGAIMSFLGENTNDAHNGFPFIVLNELYEDSEHLFDDLQDLPFRRIKKNEEGGPNGSAKKFIDALMEYEMTVVLLSDVGDYNEFNLQFARLNLGLIINSGEKLNAMVGDLRDICFGDLGQHPFLSIVSMRERRFGREQTVAQILAQVSALEETSGVRRAYARTRYYDLQRLFKTYVTMTERENLWVDRVRHLFGLLEVAKDDFVVIRSRAMLVSAVLLAYTEDIESEEMACELGGFIREFLCRLKWQLDKGLNVDHEYRYLVDFQKDVTQASVERPAVSRRAKVLREEFVRWRGSRRIRGDDEYEAVYGVSAAVACREGAP